MWWLKKSFNSFRCELQVSQKKREKIKEKKSNKKAGLAFLISCCICVCHEVHYFVLLHVQTYMSFIIFKLFNEQHIQKQIFVCPHTCMHTTSICTHAYTPLFFLSSFSLVLQKPDFHCIFIYLIKFHLWEIPKCLGLIVKSPQFDFFVSDLGEAWHIFKHTAVVMASSCNLCLFIIRSGSWVTVRRRWSDKTRLSNLVRQNLELCVDVIYSWWKVYS